MTDPALETMNRLYEIAKDFEPVDEDYFYLPGIEVPRALPSAKRKGDWPAGYSCSPTNAPWFARTGGDGVHFRFLEIGGEIREESPVIMTVPMQFDEPNYVVAENLLDFLALGCRSTYDLEELAYDKGRMIEFLKHPEKGLSFEDGDYDFDPILEPFPEQRILIEEFNLKPWKNVEERLEYLREKYLHLLVVEEGEE